MQVVNRSRTNKKRNLTLRIINVRVAYVGLCMPLRSRVTGLNGALA